MGRMKFNIFIIKEIIFIKSGTMKQYLFFLGAFALMGLSACQKEADFSNSSGNGGSSGTGALPGEMLVKVESTAFNYVGKDTVVWNTNGQLISWVEYQTYPFSTYADSFYITRQANGKIISVWERHKHNSSADTLIYNVTYRPGSDKISYCLRQRPGTFVIEDSIFFDYDASGRTIARYSYYNSGNRVYYPSTKYVFEYDANDNLLGYKTYSDNGSGSYSLDNTSSYTYNSHKPAVRMGDLVYIAEFFDPALNSPHDIASSMQDVDAYSYSNQIYNSYDRPEQITVSTSGYPLVMKFFYK